MKTARLVIFIIAIISFVCWVPGCAHSDETMDDSNVVVTPTVVVQTATPTIAPTIDPAPIVTTEPIPETTPDPTATPTPAPTEDASKVKLAEGFFYMELNEQLKTRITGMSYPADGEKCEISYDDLRYIRLLHYDFDGAVHEGELIVNARVADEVMEIFHELYKAKYPLASVRLVDDYGEPGDDNLSMAAGNTSAFNYRYVTGSSKLSRHSYGAAIDINPVLNPYIDGDRIVPENGIEYADRSLGLPGMIDHDDLCYQLFIQHGWTWGGDWSGDKDYQHFSKDLGF